MPIRYGTVFGIAITGDDIKLGLFPQAPPDNQAMGSLP
jgi:hypothetical protein